MMYSVVKGALFLDGAELLHVDSLHHLLAVDYGGLLESLAAAELFHDAGFLKFALELLQSAFNVLAFFNLYDNHLVVKRGILLLFIICRKAL